MAATKQKSVDKHYLTVNFLVDKPITLEFDNVEDMNRIAYCLSGSSRVREVKITEKPVKIIKHPLISN